MTLATRQQRASMYVEMWRCEPTRRVCFGFAEACRRPCCRRRVWPKGAWIPTLYLMPLPLACWRGVMTSCSARAPSHGSFVSVRQHGGGPVDLYFSTRFRVQHSIALSRCSVFWPTAGNASARKLDLKEWRNRVPSAARRAACVSSPRSSRVPGMPPPTGTKTHIYQPAEMSRYLAGKASSGLLNVSAVLVSCGSCSTENKNRHASRRANCGMYSPSSSCVSPHPPHYRHSFVVVAVAAALGSLGRRGGQAEGRTPGRQSM